MKTIICFLLILLNASFILSTKIASAQTFWTEDFGNGCNSATPANGFTGANGTWIVSSTGTNDNYADVWYVSAKANNTGNGQCASNCSNANNPTLHIGNADLTTLGVGPDSSCTYLTGLFCSSLNICSTTHKRVESPVIDCTGRIAISIAFLYLENGEGSDDDATLWYYDGNTWTLIDSLSKTIVCGSYGIWTLFTSTLPSSADNNPLVKIAFNWTNDNDATGSDPSFAIDNIRMLGSPTSIEEDSFNITEDEITINPNPALDILNINCRNSKIVWIELIDMLGQRIHFMSTQNINQNNVIDTSQLRSGIYLASVLNEQGNLYVKRFYRK